MTTRNALISVAAAVLSVLAARAQPPHYFTWYNAEGNQPLKTIHQICQDRQGYLWLATWDGLLRFDGLEFSRYSLPADKMTNRFINVTADRNDDIWTTTYDNCLYRFDKRTSRFEEVDGGAESGFFIDRDGSHIYRLSSGDSITRISIAEDRSLTMSGISTPEGARTSALFFQTDGQMWMLSDKGPCLNGEIALNSPVFSASERGGDLFFGSESGTIYRLSDGTVELFRLPSAGRITSIVQVPFRDELIAASSDSEVFAVRLKDKKVTVLQSSSFPPGGAVDIISDNAGKIWVSSNLGGVDWYDPENQRLIPFYDSAVQQSWNSENRATAIFPDRQGILWVGTNWNGLMKVVFNEDRFFLKRPSDSGNGGITPENSIRALMEDREGNIWAGTKDGHIHIYDRRMSDIGHLNPDGSISRKPKGDFGSIYTMRQDRDGTIWMGTRRDGLFELKAPEKKGGRYEIRHHAADKDSYYGLNGAEIFSVDPDSSGRLWIASFDDGLAYLDIASGNFISKKNRLHFPTEHKNRLRFVTHSSQGSIYACGTLGVFVCEDSSHAPEDLSFRHHLLASWDESQSNARDVQHITIAEDGQIYACTYGGGFYRFPDKVIGTKDGMMSDFTLSSVQDASGNLWIATDGGLNKYNPTNGGIEGFSYERLGYRIRFNEGAPLRTSDGNICFNTSGGILYFNPESISNSQYSPPMNISAEEITARAGKDITVNFQAMDMTAPERIIYYYKIDGGEWLNIGSRRSLTLHNLRIGRHRLELRSTNGNGMEADNSVPVDITIQPQALLSGWAIAAYIVLASAGAGAVVLRKRKRRRETEPYYGNLQGADRKFVKDMIDYISEHIEESDLDVQKIACALNVSRSKLFERTKTLLNTSPAAIIRDIRFKRAAILIREGEHSLSEVAYLSGFNDTHYFSTSFKQKFGMTPGEYRKNHYIVRRIQKKQV